MAYYALLVEVEMEGGIVRLNPVGGFDGPATGYFFKLACSSCGEMTVKDVCVFPDGDPCSYRLSTKALEMCYPRCAASGHMVRKCKGCENLGSLSLIPGKGEDITTSSKTMVMLIHCNGYTPMSFSLAERWIGTKATGDQCELTFSGDGFESYDDAEDEMIVRSASFTIDKLYKAQVP